MPYARAARPHAAPDAPPWPRRAAVVLLACWCTLGLLHTAYVMVRPHGLILRRPPGLARAIGLPDPIGSRVVTEALELLASEGVTGTPGAEATAAPQAVPGPVLLVRPPSDARPFWDYLHYQLAHLSYPQRIDLVAAGGTAPLAVESDAAVGYSPGNYTAILAPPGVALGPGWEPRQRGTALILYGPARP